MSSPDTHHDHSEPEHTPDGVEAIVPSLPIVLPVAGGVLMFLLAFIAITVA